jgi:hypothetical protein
LGSGAVTLYTFLNCSMCATCFHLSYLSRSEQPYNVWWRVQNYAVFSILLSLPYSWAKIVFAEPCSQSSSVCVLPLMSETKFNTRTKL